MSNSDRVLAYIQSVYPAGATNEEIVGHTGIRPHAQVFQITNRLMEAKIVKGIREGNEWRFYAATGEPAELVRSQAVKGKSADSTPAGFEKLAQIAMSAFFQTALAPRQVPGVPKMFDLVSTDNRIVGDAKFYTLVRGVGLPPAKFSVIAEHVWLLEKANADRRFLVFGNDRRVPEEWLKRYGHLARDVEFYFIADDGVPCLIDSNLGVPRPAANPR